MVRIETIRLREVRMALVEPFRISSGTVTERRILLVEVIDADGTRGWGECPAGESPNYSPETIDTAWQAITHWVAPRVLGRGFEHPRDVYPALQKSFRGHNMAKAAVEMAIWELVAQREGVPLSRLLGGTRETIETGISIGIQKDPATLVEKAKAALAQGYRKIKMKIEPGSDVEFVRAVREALGSEAPLMADANNAYTLEETDRLVLLDELDLVMIEQPLAHDDIVRHARLQKRLRTPICLDESITGLDRAQDMIELGAGRIVNIKPSRVGGFSQSIAIHDLCRENDIPVWCGGMLESGVGRAHNVALASLPNFKIPGDVSPSARYWKEDIVDPEWVMDGEGRVRVPLDRKGMGVEPRLDRIEKLTVRMDTIGKE
jgi:O-succinylbenzoate synthase